MNLVKLTVFLWLSSALRALREVWAKDDGDPPASERTVLHRNYKRYDIPPYRETAETLPSVETAEREMVEVRERMRTRERFDTLPSAHAAWPTLAKTRGDRKDLN